MENEDLRSVSDNTRSSYRKRAISLIKQGKRKGDIAILFGVNKNTISNWWKNYEERGSASFVSKKRGVKSEDKKLLSNEQERAIQKMIVDKMPEQLKLNFALWTCKAVQELVEREFNVVLARTTMGDYLRKWGFTSQKPKKQAYEQCPKKVQKWLDEEYPTIKEQAKQENAEIHWGDEMQSIREYQQKNKKNNEQTGVKNQCNHGRSYAPKGQTPVKKSMSKRFSVNMVSAITNQGKVQFMIYSDTMNAERLIEFMKQLIKSSSRKVYLILDNLKMHHSKIVKQWVEDNKEKIALFYLPS